MNTQNTDRLRGTQNGLTAVIGEGDWGVLHENVKESIRKKVL